MTADPPRQFGKKRAGLTYRPRPCAYGIAARADGRLAIAQIRKGLWGHEYDLPGGALDGDETEQAAMIREFREETGLSVKAGAALGVAGQYWRKRSMGPTNNICHFYEARIVGGPDTPEEPDHELIWLTPDEARRKMRHEAHAWALDEWMEKTTRDPS